MRSAIEMSAAGINIDIQHEKGELRPTIGKAMRCAPPASSIGTPVRARRVGAFSHRNISPAPVTAYQMFENENEIMKREKMESYQRQAGGNLHLFFFNGLLAQFRFENAET